MADEREDLFLDLSESNQEGSEEQENNEGQEGSEGQENQEGSQEQENNEGQEGSEEEGSQEQENNEGQENIELDDSKVLKVLSEKLGREITSFDELTKAEEKQLNPQIQAISDWAEKTGRPIEDWVKYNKDYSTMSDVEKAREILSLKYPTLTEKEIQLELNQFLESEDDLEEDIDLKTLNLKKLIANDGKLLDEVKLELGKPLDKGTELPEELREQLTLAKQIKDDYDQSLVYQRNYNENIKKTVSEMTSIALDLDEGLSISYNMSPEDKKELPSFLAEMPHWRNPDGSMNHKNIAEDALKIKNFDKMLKMAFQQGKASGKDEVIKEAANITLDGRQTNEQQPDGANKGIVIEGLGSYERTGAKVKFGKPKN